MKHGISELTIRGLVLGVLITVVFTAANVYLGLKVGLTFATSLPAAVISMAVLAGFRDSSVLENNIVQTVASAAGTLSAIIFVLPGLVIIGWWTGFPFWLSFFVCASGGVLGVLMTIPLRRAMVVNSDLPFPEGVAAAEVLEVGAAARGAAPAAREGLVAIIFGAVCSTLLALVAATRIAATEFSVVLSLGGTAATRIEASYSLALLGVGHLVGLSVGLSMLTGLLIAWGALVPLLTAQDIETTLAPAQHVQQIWSTQVRFIGAGAMLVAAIWTLIKLARPVIGGFASAISAARLAKAGTIEAQDRDMAPRWIGLLTLVSLIVIAILVIAFLDGTPLADRSAGLTAAAVIYTIVVGFVVAGICGYMAGLIGASNSPLSGVGILAIISCAGTIAIFSGAQGPELRMALVAYALFITAIVFAIATISNNNLQDLKTGQLVGATPAAQQWALIVGVLAGSAVIPPVLDLLAHAFGFASTGPNPLPAPQASLISALAQGVIGQALDWNLILQGMLIGLVIVAIDEALARGKRFRLPPLAVGMGIYLPMGVTLPLVIGAIFGHAYRRWIRATPDPARADQLGILIASGMLVGESLFGVLLAGLIVGLSNNDPLALVPADFSGAEATGILCFAVLLAAPYIWAMTRSRRTT